MSFDKKEFYDIPDNLQSINQHPLIKNSRLFINFMNEIKTKVQTKDCSRNIKFDIKKKAL